MRPTNRRPRLRCALIGTGRQAREQLIPSLLLAPDVSIAAVCSRTRERAEAVAEAVGADYATTEWEKIVESDEIDAVIACVDSQLHFAIAEACLQRARHVFVEKPPCQNREQMSRLVAAERATSDVVGFVGLNFSFGASFRSWRRDAEKSDPVAFARIRLVSSGPHAPGEFPSTRANLLYNLGLHALDLARCLIGPIRSVESKTIPLSADRFAEHLTVTGSQGATAFVELGNYSARFEYAVEIVGQSGRRHVLDQHNRLYAHRAWSDAPLDFLPAATVAHYEWPSRRGGYDRTGYQTEINEFIDAIRSGAASPSSFARCADLYAALEPLSSHAHT